jgi:MFS transporter, DHA2 family, multidrug resistance protein
MIMRYIEDPDYIRNAKPGKIDGIGLGLLALWLGCLQIVLDKGQEDDWFGADWIRWAVGILVVSFVLFVIRELTHDNPLVDLRVFRHRNFLIGCILIGLFGGALYGLITLLPLFYQELLGYTASAAGWAVGPRGIGAIIAVPIMGILTSKVDNRWLIAAGFVMFGISSLRFGQADLAISQWSFLWAIVLSGFGTGFIFVPLSTTAVAGLKNEEIGNASGLYNLFRNVGGSVGIAMVNTIIARHAQLHQNELVRSIVPSSVTVQNQVHALQQYLQTQGYGPVDALQRAYALIARQVEGQSLLWSYVDDFRYLALLCFACIPIVFILKKAVARRGVAGVGH